MFQEAAAPAAPPPLPSASIELSSIPTSDAVSSQPVSWEDVGGFLWPQDAAFQHTFIITIVAIAALAFLWALRTGNETSWSERWKGGLRSGHGSIHDLSEAVASPAERVIQVLPGIVLVIGLLGTFIGLGVALNDASQMIQAGPEGLSGVEGVIDAIGMKFTTSTWGLICFLALRLATALMGWDDKRLRWCVERINDDAAEQRSEDIARDAELHAKLRAEVRDAGRENALRVAGEVSRFNEAAVPILQKIQSHEELAEQSLSKFVRSNVESLESLSKSASEMQGAATKMSKAAELSGKSATALSDVIANFGSNVSTTLNGLKADMVGVIRDVDVSFDNNLRKMSADMSSSSKDISSTMEKLEKSVRETMTGVQGVISEMKTTIDDAREKQAISLSHFQSAAQQLSENAMHMQTPIKELGHILEDKFGTIGDIGLEVGSLHQKNIKTAEASEKTNESLQQVADRLGAIEWLSAADLRRLEAAIDANTRGLEAISDLVNLLKPRPTPPGAPTADARKAPDARQDITRKRKT